MIARRYFVSFILILVLCLCALCYINFGSDFLFKTKLKLTEEEVFSFPKVQNTYYPSRKIILYWNTFFGKNDFYFGEGPVSLHCPRYSNCFATHVRDVEHVEKVDAIVFHGINEELSKLDLPVKRNSKQMYIFVSMESPINRYIHNEFDNYFNITMTYQLNSDVIWTYADVVDKNNKNILFVPSKNSVKWKEHTVNHEEEEADEQINSVIKGKRKLAVWYRSNCETRSGRENYVNELDKYVTVDKFGGCSLDVGCSREKDCFKTDVEPNYFFYLSFENSLCDDYVTEKFYNALKYYVVPVVYGGANYNQFAPPNSFINALDFESPKDLAKYLTRLTKNITEYKKYFEWKKEYIVSDPNKRVICDLCEIINSDHTNSYKISKWYSADKCPIQRRLDQQIAQGGVNYATKGTAKNI